MQIEFCSLLILPVLSFNPGDVMQGDVSLEDENEDFSPDNPLKLAQIELSFLFLIIPALLFD